SRDIVTIGTKDDSLHPSFDLANARKSPATCRGGRGIDCYGEIADAITYKWHAVVIEIGNNDFTHLPGLSRPSLFDDLHNVILGDNQVAVMPFRFVGDSGKLPASILIKHFALEFILNDCSTLLRQNLSGGYYPFRTNPFQSVCLDVVCQKVERFCIAVDE